MRGSGGPEQPPQLGSHGRLLAQVVFKVIDFLTNLIFREKVIDACG